LIAKHRFRQRIYILLQEFRAGKTQRLLHARQNRASLKSNMLIQKYTSAWASDFANLKREIEKALGQLDCRIEHVGSTSVPGLDSKPIIDIDIIYYKPGDFELIKPGLEKIGYYHNGNQGIEGREVFKRSGSLINQFLDTIQHHLYVCPVNSKALERHILLRDYLRKHDWARLAYQQMKYELAEEARQDRKLYAELKELKINGFIDLVIDKERIERTMG
jgi:GrpB-like predicted nucleotidyltransferase (UPF0157 family)